MTGLHGANRLASNSLLEALVFAHRAALPRASRCCADDGAAAPDMPTVGSRAAPSTATSAVVVTQNWDEIRRFMWNYVGIVRSDRRLARARSASRSCRTRSSEYYWDFLVDRRPGRAAQHRAGRRADHPSAPSPARRAAGCTTPSTTPKPMPRVRATRSCGATSRASPSPGPNGPAPRRGGAAATAYRRAGSG